MRACFDFRIPLDSLQVLLCRGVFSLQKHSSFHWKFRLFLAFLMGFFELLVIRINKADASQLSRIVELRFPDSPLLLFLSLSCL